jgi:hypothetical protein
VKRGVDGVKGGGIGGGCAKEGDIGHVGNPKKRHVHADVGRSGDESRAKSGRGNAVEDDGVARDVGGVVEVDEGIADGWGEDGENAGEEKSAGRAMQHGRFRKAVGHGRAGVVSMAESLRKGLSWR